MKIYLASSWKNAEGVKSIAQLLRIWGHEVDCFCDQSTGRFVFFWTDIEKDIDRFNAKSYLQHPMAKRVFEEDRKWIEWSDAVVMVKPCGNSSHLEAGYAKGLGKKLYIFSAEFKHGEFDAMYGFADELIDDFARLREVLND